MGASICYSYTTNGYHRTLWTYLGTAFVLDASYELGLDASVSNPDGIIPIASYAELPADRKLVIASPQTARFIVPTMALPDYIHPVNAIYVFGSDREFMKPEDLVPHTGYDVVYVPNKSAQIRDEYWSMQAGMAFLYDRLSKSWPS